MFTRPPNDPHEWLDRARSNLIRAKQRGEGIYLEDLCFDAQQAAEKALKALLIHSGVYFPYTHDIAQLLTLVSRTERSIPESIRQAAGLTEYAVASRYPGVAEPVIELEYQEAVVTAERVVRWVEAVIRGENAPER